MYANHLLKNHPKIYPKSYHKIPPYNPPKIHASFDSIRVHEPCQIHTSNPYQDVPQIHAKIVLVRDHE